MRKFIDQLNFKDRTILITGAAGFLGRTFATTLAELGATLVLVDRDAPELANFSKQIEADWGVRAEFIPSDLEVESDRDEIIKICRSTGALDVLVNNAAFVGTSDLDGWAVPFHSQELDAWRRAFEVNLTAVFHLSRDLSPILGESDHGGSIINIASIYGEFAPDWSLYSETKMGNPAAYGVSKSGLIHLTKWLATTLAPNVRVNAISPGGIYRDQEPNFVTRYEGKTPMGRMATESDICGTVIFLASDMSQYVTGENIRVSGGWGI